LNNCDIFMMLCW